jgi:hypothetical protein
MHSKGSDSLARAFCTHPLIEGLATDYTFPSYIPPMHFALVYMDLAIHAEPATERIAPRISVQGHIGGDANLSNLTSTEARVARSLIADETNTRVVQARIEKWFTDSGERLSGAYKRSSYLSLLIISLLVCFVFGVDSIRLVASLYSDPNAAQRVAQAAAGAAQQKSTPITAPAVPLGWYSPPDGKSPWQDSGFWSYVAGCGITSLALTLGAPFWFDMISLFVNPRQTGDPPSGKRPITG